MPRAANDYRLPAAKRNDASCRCLWRRLPATPLPRVLGGGYGETMLACESDGT